MEKEKKELWQYFFNKPKNNYNKYMFEFPNYSEYIIYDDEVIIKNKGNWSKNIFNNNNPLHLEIGCGSGTFTHQLSLKNININFLGIEIRLKRLIQAGKKAKKTESKNLKFLKKRIFKLSEFIAPNELDALYINFPDPWENEEHKRIFSEKLLEDLDIVLKKGSKIYFKTDHLKYYYDVLELINKSSNYDLLYNTDDLYSSEKVLNNIKTEFEHLFISKHNMKIKYIEILKK